MNKQQLIDVLKGVLIAGGPVVSILVNLLGMETGAAEKIVQGMGALVSVGGIVWLAMSRTDSNMVKNAADVKGVQVHVNEDVAPPAVVKLAEDKKVTDVYPMEGGPRVPPKDEDAHEGPAPDSPPTYRNP
jgi:hypothetical protein